jgi:hypothetical protein
MAKCKISCKVINGHRLYARVRESSEIKYTSLLSYMRRGPHLEQPRELAVLDPATIEATERPVKRQLHPRLVSRICDAIHIPALINRRITS